MRRIFLSFSLLLLVSCGKNDSNNSAKSIDGHWRLKAVHYSDGKEMSIVKGMYRFQNGEFSFSDSSRPNWTTPIKYEVQNDNLIVYYPGSTERSKFELSGNTLRQTELNYDGTTKPTALTHTYTKLSESESNELQAKWKRASSLPGIPME